jgi:CheY-like chemotaxis protein
MDSDTQMRLFEPFFTTKEEGKGTGVGLSMVYDIVTRSGGYITVESEPDRGARFRLYFPRAAEASAAADDTPAVEPSRGDETVLIAEDDANVRRLVERILRRQGYAVLEADGGREAIEICSRYQGDIALLVTDVVMKDMSGHELYESLAPFRAGMRVLYMSGYPDHAIAHHGVRGEAPFIGKPFTPEALASKVREVLDRSTCVSALVRLPGIPAGSGSQSADDGPLTTGAGHSTPPRSSDRRGTAGARRCAG